MREAGGVGQAGGGVGIGLRSSNSALIRTRPPRRIRCPPAQQLRSPGCTIPSTPRTIHSCTILRGYMKHLKR